MEQYLVVIDRIYVSDNTSCGCGVMYIYFESKEKALAQIETMKVYDNDTIKQRFALYCKEDLI